MKGVVIFLLTCIWSYFSVFSQEIYNNCSNALELCPNQIYSINNIDANVAVCPTCEDAFAFCFTPDNTIWTTFTTNATGGNVTVSCSNLVFEVFPGRDTELQAAVVQAGFPCDGSTLSLVGTCVSNATGNFVLNAAGLAPNTTYYVVFDGDNTGAGIVLPAECTLDVAISGPGVDRPIPSISLIEPSSPVCAQEIVTFSAITSDCPDNPDYRWYINGVLVATTIDSFFQTTALQNGDIVQVETDCYLLCPEITSVTGTPVSVVTFLVEAGPDQTINVGQSVVLGGLTGAPVFNWSPSFLVSNPQSLNPITSPTETTTFTLTATQNGCTFSDQTTVFVETGIEIPNTFSPNGDGDNDTWLIKGLQAYPNSFISIYNRWGTLVYDILGYSDQKAWNGGSLRGTPLAEGVYFYVIELRDSEEQVFKGSITLIR